MGVTWGQQYVSSAVKTYHVDSCIVQSRNVTGVNDRGTDLVQWIDSPVIKCFFDTSSASAELGTAQVPTADGVLWIAAADVESIGVKNTDRIKLVSRFSEVMGEPIIYTFDSFEEFGQLGYRFPLERYTGSDNE